MVIDENLPLGMIANTAAIMGITLGKKIPEVIGVDVADYSGNKHLGITRIPVPILKGNPTLIKRLRQKLYQSEYKEMVVVDFSDVAQSCMTYDEFIGKIANVPESDIQYLGITLYDEKKLVNKLTGSLPLLR